MAEKTMYRIGGHRSRIETVTVVKETRCFVWVRETVQHAFSGKTTTADFQIRRDQIFDTFIAARSYLIDEARKAVDHAEERLRVAREKLARAENLREPD